MVQIYKEGGENSTSGKLPWEFTVESFESTISGELSLCKGCYDCVWGVTTINRLNNFVKLNCRAISNQ